MIDSKICLSAGRQALLSLTLHDCKMIDELITMGTINLLLGIFLRNLEVCHCHETMVESGSWRDSFVLIHSQHLSQDVHEGDSVVPVGDRLDGIAFAMDVHHHDILDAVENIFPSFL